MPTRTSIAMEGIETSALTEAQLKAVQDDLGITGTKALANKAKNTADEHIADKNNPHEVTKEQLGLDEVVNRGFDASMSLESENHLSNKVITANCNGAICTTASGASAKTIDIEGFTLFTGAVVRVLFMHGSSSENPTLNVNATGARLIKVVKGGDKIAPPVHSGKWRGASEYTNEAWQPYTTLELIYDGTDWVIMGNPEVENYSDSNGGYSIKANGFIQQRHKIYRNSSDITIEFYVKYSDKNYGVSLSIATWSTTIYIAKIYTGEITEKSIRVIANSADAYFFVNTFGN